MTTMDLVEFLLARIAEDEAAARAANQRVGGASAKVSPAPLYELNEWGTAETAHFGHRFDPARLLAECDAKRRIVEAHSVPADEVQDDGTPDCPDCWQTWPCNTLRLLALPYADHPEYREEWKP